MFDILLQAFMGMQNTILIILLPFPLVYHLTKEISSPIQNKKTLISACSLGYLNGKLQYRSRVLWVKSSPSGRSSSNEHGIHKTIDHTFKFQGRINCPFFNGLLDCVWSSRVGNFVINQDLFCLIEKGRISNKKFERRSGRQSW